MEIKIQFSADYINKSKESCDMQVLDDLLAWPDGVVTFYSASTQISLEPDTFFCMARTYL